VVAGSLKHKRYCRNESNWRSSQADDQNVLNDLNGSSDLSASSYF